QRHRLCHLGGEGALRESRRRIGESGGKQAEQGKRATNIQRKLRKTAKGAGGGDFRPSRRQKPRRNGRRSLPLGCRGAMSPGLANPASLTSAGGCDQSPLSA